MIMQTMKAAGEALVDASDRLFAIDVSLNRVKGLIVQTEGDNSLGEVVITAALSAETLKDICGKLETHIEGVWLKCTVGTHQLRLQFRSQNQQEQ